LVKSGYAIFHPVHGERLMQEIARASGYRLSRTTLKHIKSFLSGVFTFARRQGVTNTANPMQGVSIPRGAEPIDTHAYSLEEITAMLAVLDGPARVLVATAAFTGLRRSEIRGLRWEDFDPSSAGRFRRTPRRAHGLEETDSTNEDPSQQGVSPGHPGAGKHPRRVRAVAEIQPPVCLRRGERSHAPGNSTNFAKRYIEPVLSAHGARWRWWHPFRRGWRQISIDSAWMTDDSIPLRHSSVQTTREIYIKGFDGDAVAAMKRLETAISPGRTEYATTMQLRER
jgi:integrase